MWLNHFENNVIWAVFKLFLKLHSHITVLWRFCRISVISEFSCLSIGLKTKTRKSREISIFIVYKIQMHMDLFFDLYFNFLSVKIEINKKHNKRLDLINLEGSDALERQKYDTWIAMWLNNFQNNVFWTVFRGVLELHSYILVFWGFSWISMVSEFSYLGGGLKMKTWKSPKIFISIFFSQTLSNLLLCFSFLILIASICNSLVQLLFPWFPWFLRFSSFRPGL